MHRICAKYDLDVFSFMPVTFVFNIEDPDFFQEIDHFFRYFKGLEIYNIFRENLEEEKKIKTEQILIEEEEIIDSNFPIESKKIKIESVDEDDKDELILGESDILKIPQKINQVASPSPLSEEYNLKQVYMSIVEEVMRVKMNPSLKESGVLKPSEKFINSQYQNLGKRRVEILNKAINKRLLKILNNPGHIPNDKIEELFHLTLEQIVKEKPDERPEKNKKWCPVHLFKKSLFNKKKKVLKIPGKKEFMECYYNSNLSPCFNKGRNLWLLKVSQYNRGFGIELFTDLTTFAKHLSNFKVGYQESLTEKQEKKGKKGKTIVAQSAIEIKQISAKKTSNKNHFQKKDMFKSQVEISNKNQGIAFQKI